MGLVAGFFVAYIPRWISWLKFTSFLYYGFGLLLKVQLMIDAKNLHRLDSVKVESAIKPNVPQNKEACCIMKHLRPLLAKPDPV